jgi:phospholipase C
MDVASLRTSIKTVVAVLLENRSFDPKLGHLSLPEFGGPSRHRGCALAAGFGWQSVLEQRRDLSLSWK